MINDIIRFAVLGLGAGGVYALTALGLVLIYRGSGLINFSHGAVGMVGAYTFYNLRNGGQSTVVAWLAALAVGMVLGAVTHIGVMRSLRHAPALTRLVATLGIFSVLIAYGTARYGDGVTVVTRILPTSRVQLWGSVVVGEDRLVVLSSALAATLVLGLVYRHTRFGLATAAVAENRQAAAAQGWSPDLIATVNWSAGSVLAVIGAILIVNIAGLSVEDLSLLVIPALAAALFGRLTSFPLTLVGALIIGVCESEIDWLRTFLSQHWHRSVGLDGWAESVPFLLIIIVLVVRGRSIPLRSEKAEQPPSLGNGRVQPVKLAVGLAVALFIASSVLSRGLLNGLSSSVGISIVALSLVVVTGYAGQLSLAQYGLAGIGAWITAVLIAHHHWGLIPAAAVGIVGTIPVGVIVGLPSLRTRGINLAIATLGLASVIQAQILGNASRTGGLDGLHIGSPSLFGIDLDPTRHPARFAVASLVCLTAVALVVANLRRSASGRRMIAVRTNERAAASLGINVMGVKVHAFAVSAAIAAVGGIVILVQNPVAVFLPSFSTVNSVLVVVYAVIGGIGYVIGGVTAGVVAPGGIGVAAINSAVPVFNSSNVAQIAVGASLILMLIIHPSGAASLMSRARSLTPGKALNRRREKPALPEPRRRPASRAALEVEGVSVRYGGVAALSDVDLAARPGEVTGLIGPNGAGKTTLIDAITGFASSTGAIRIGGRDISDWKPHRRARAGIGRTFQNLELFDTMTVRENLQTAADRPRLLGGLRDLVRPHHVGLDAHVAAVVQRLGLDADLDRTVGELSYGRRRLVAIARSLASAPAVLLLDEPASGLDDAETATLSEIIRDLAVDWELAIVLIEHDVSLVLDVCDTIVVLDQGAHLFTGTPSEVRHHDGVIEAYLGPSQPEDVPTGTGVRSTPPSGLEPVLRVAGLHAGYGELAVVRDLDLEVRPGEVVALLGPNGAGKTTTLLTVAGELPPLAGEVAVLGRSNRKLHHLVRAGVGFVPAESVVVRQLSGQANLRLGHRNWRLALELFPELEDLLDRRGGLLSGGEQQMLALARALAGGPRLLLIDEMSAGLAPLIVGRLLRAVRRAADEHNVGVLIVEQHTTQVLSIADRAVLLRQGRVQMEADGERLRNDASLLQAAYMTGIP